MLKKHDVPATFYVPAVAALLHPDEQRQVIAEGHEIGIHSWIHELNSVLSYEAESDIMRRAADTLEKITGVRPVGARTASWDFSPHTLRITKEMGLLYDSSLMADEDCYELVLDGEPTGVVELPVEWIRDDAVYFMMHRFQSLRPQMPVEAVFDIFRREFDMRVRGRRHLPDHHAPALHRLPLAHLDHRGADPSREVAAGRVVRDPCGGRRLRQGARRLMRIAVIADIHGNVRALRAVMDDIKALAPDTVVNLGDCVSGPLEAAETADLLISLAWTTVRGNHDRQLLDRPVDKMGSFGPRRIRRIEEPPCGLAFDARRRRPRSKTCCSATARPTTTLSISTKPSTRTAASGLPRRRKSSAGSMAPVHASFCAGTATWRGWWRWMTDG